MCLSDGSLKLVLLYMELSQFKQKMEGDKKSPSSSEFSQLGHQKSL